MTVEGAVRPWEFYHGDGVDGLLAHGPVDHTITDPPYLESVESGHQGIEVRDNRFDFEPMTEELRNRAARAIAQQTRRWALVFCSIEEAHLWRIELETAGMIYSRTGIWIRQGTAPQFNGMEPAQAFEAIVIAHSRVLTQRWNGGGKPAIWYAPIVHGNRIHETQKPTKLISELIMDFTDEGESIGDPFAGSATTGRAALGLGRRFVGWESNRRHYLNGLQRLELDRPLLENRVPEQIDLLECGGPSSPPKGSAAKARMELERTLLETIRLSGTEGVKASELPDLGTPRERRSALQRLQKRLAIVREGRTVQTRWFVNPRPIETENEENGSRRERSHPEARHGAQPTFIDEPVGRPGDQLDPQA